MLTQIQTTDRQVTLLATCPRPRALAFVPAASVITETVIINSVSTKSVSTKSELPNRVPTNSVPTASVPTTSVPTTSVPTTPVSTSHVTTTVPAPWAPSAWSQLAPISAAAFARVPGFGAMAGYAVFAPRPMSGFGTDSVVRRDGEGFVGLNRENGSTSSKQQDQKHLTARREPVTWRPPH